MKKALILLHDYWHPRESIEPALESIFQKDRWEISVSDDPNVLYDTEIPDLFVTFKDVIENDQIPTPLWCTDDWNERLDSLIKGGMGFMAVHCGIADIPKDCLLTTDILRGFFITHPPQCSVGFVPQGEHPVLNGVSEFTFDSFDEHYQIEIVGETNILGYTESQHGRQPALWCHEYGGGRVLAITPGHSYENLAQAEYLKLLRNCADWCAGDI